MHDLMRTGKSFTKLKISLSFPGPPTTIHIWFKNFGILFCFTLKFASFTTFIYHFLMIVDKSTTDHLLIFMSLYVLIRLINGRGPHIAAGKTGL